MTRFELINNQIEEIMDTFDFSKIRIAMEALDWKWSNDIPEEYELRRSARSLMKSLIDFKESGFISSGGFTTRLTQGVENNEKWLRIDLSFSIEDSLLNGETYE